MSSGEINYNAIASFEKSKQKKQGSRSIRAFTVVLLAIFFVVLMTGLAAGVAMYQGNGPEGRSLVLTKQDADGNTYEMRLYLYKGNIVQEYSATGTAYTPNRAQPLLASKSFDFELHGDLLVIRTDQGATNVALRSYQGGVS